MRSRVLVIARFAVYAVVVAIGVHQLLDRADASEPNTRPVLAAETTQGLPVSLWTSNGRVARVELEWRGTCESGERIRSHDFFNDSHAGDWARDGQGFKDEVRLPYGPHRVLEGRLSGVAEDGVARGSVSFTVTVHGREGVADTCTSGPIGFAVDLPD